MNIIFVLITVSLSIAIGFLLLFIWNVKSGQYEDTLTPSLRMLFENNLEKEHVPEKDVEKTGASTQ